VYGKMMFVMVLVLLLVMVILLFELHDRRANRRNQKIFRDGVRVRGTCICVKRQGALDARDGEPWSIVVDFEYGGNKYSIEGKSVRKPVYSVGDSVSVYVDVEDSWKSVIII